MSLLLNPKSLCQIEIQVSNLEAAAAFYAAVFGWQVAPAAIHEYLVLDVPQDSPFGISLVPRRESVKSSSSITLYFAVPTVETAEKLMDKSEACGGQTIFRAKRLPGYGLVWVTRDVDGQRWGIFVPSLAHNLDSAKDQQE